MKWIEIRPVNEWVDEFLGYHYNEVFSEIRNLTERYKELLWHNPVLRLNCLHLRVGFENEWVSEWVSERATQWVGELFGWADFEWMTK